jgi:hypothetical protein
MLNWIFRAGYILIAVGLLLLTPIGDYLPIDIFFGSPPGYYKVVAATDSNRATVILFGLGLALVLLGLLLRRLLRKRASAGDR